MPKEEQQQIKVVDKEAEATKEAEAAAEDATLKQKAYDNQLDALMQAESKVEQALASQLAA